jgi:transitional endoplasmic reticulum ATPase
MPPQHSVLVQVAASGLDDAGEPRARVSRTLLESLGLKPGAPVRLVAGDRSVLLHAHPAGQEDDGLNVVRVDGSQRHRLGVEVGDTATLERYDGAAAECVTLVAIGNLPEDLPMDDIRAALAERPVVVGDSVKVTPTRKTFDVDLNLLGLTVAGVSGAVNDADGVLLRVSDTTPSGVVTVGDGTRIDVRHATASEDATRA